MSAGRLWSIGRSGKIGVIVNPHARIAKRAGLVEAITRAAGDDALVRRTDTFEALEAAVVELAAHKVDVIAACGGDGTHVATIGAMLRVYGQSAGATPPYLFLPGGTMNTVAGNLGARGAPEARLLAWRKQRQTGVPAKLTTHTLVAVQGRHGFIFAAAMGARFLEAYYAGFGGAGTAGLLGPGPLWAAALGLRTAASCLVQGSWAQQLFGPLEAELVVDGELAPGPFRLLVASSVVNVGLGMRVAWRAGEEPGRIHLVASGITPLGLGLQLGRVLRGRPLDGQPHVDRLMTRATLRFLEPTIYTLDGELYSAREVTVTAGPELRVVHV